tara:strand:+ start:9313 stop:10065 length:753 start_codon:yes stop_codon:yes gene_type:complete
MLIEACNYCFERWFSLYALGYCVLGFEGLLDVGWRYINRIFALLHATGCVIYTIRIINRFGLFELWQWDFYYSNREGIIEVAKLNAFMQAYLLVDATFNIFELIRTRFFNTRYQIVPIDWMMFIHHIVGASSMMAFIVTERLQFNSVYYAFTELSTIPLHLGWFIHNLNYQNTPVFKQIFITLSILIVVTFFMLRNLGSFIVMYYIYENYYKIRAMNWIVQSFIFYGNTAITILNFVWFYKIIKMAMKIF